MTYGGLNIRPNVVEPTQKSKSLKVMVRKRKRKIVERIPDQVSYFSNDFEEGFYSRLVQIQRRQKLIQQ